MGVSSDRDNGRRPSVHQIDEREQGAAMRHNSLGGFACLLESFPNFNCHENPYTARPRIYRPIISKGISEFVLDQKLVPTLK